MRLCLLLVLAPICWAAGPRVEIRGNEVWILQDGQARQLTNDGKSKLEAIFSPSANRIAYYEQCPESEHCVPSVVILDLDGRRLHAFHPLGDLCNSILGISWTAESSIAAECHINPSLSEYVENDIATGKTIRDLLGYDFTPSPDGRYVAHVGAIPHFAPPFAHSNYLQIDNTTVYPLPEGVSPGREKPDVVRQNGSTWSGIHEFLPGFFWSPDSARVAFVDCLYDWVRRPGPDDIGDEGNRRCFAAVVTRTGQSILFPAGLVGEADKVSFTWDNPHQLTTRIGGTVRKLSIP